jgi:Cytochrome P460
VRRILVLIVTGCLLVAAFVTSQVVRSDFEQLAQATAGGEPLHRVTATPFEMDPVAASQCVAPDRANPHLASFGHVYVNKPGHQTMMTGSGKYPPGSVIVKQKFSAGSIRSVVLHTLMKKMQPGFDPAHNDWEYSVADETGRRTLAAGRIESCIGCHSQYQDTDYVTRKYLTR